jgi:hypothetical protein
MNAGLTNLDRLKKHLLPSSLKGDTTWDQVIADIGLGVAALFVAALNRDLAYKEDDEIIITGDRGHYCLPRYPLVSIKSVGMRYYDANPWQDITGQPLRTDAKAGMIHFGGVLGTEALQVKIIWTGGYFYEQLEPEDEGYPSQAPAGVAVMPDDLIGAFLLQCRAVWQLVDKSGADMLKSDGGQNSVATLQTMALIPIVKQMLNEYVRYQLS